MDHLAFIDSMAGHLAWPIVVLVVVLVLRNQIKDLFSRLEEGEAAGVKVKLTKAVTNAVSKVEEAQATTSADAASDEPPPPADRPGQEQGHVWHQQLDALHEAAQRGHVSPRTAVIEGWVWIEAALNNAAEALELSRQGPRARTSETVRALVRERQLPSTTADALKSLQHVRNRASHEREFELSPDVAAEYVLACANMVDLVEAATRHIVRSREMEGVSRAGS